jgi:hypothetical protein
MGARIAPTRALHTPGVEPQQVVDAQQAPRSRLPGPMSRWSFGLLVVAVLRILDAAGRLAVGLGIHGLPVTGVGVINSLPEAARAADIALAVATFIGVLGLLLYRRWGWVLTMVLVGVELALGLIRWWAGAPDYVTLAILVITTFYLNQRSLRAIVSDGEDPALGPVQP